MRRAPSGALFYCCEIYFRDKNKAPLCRLEGALCFNTSVAIINYYLLLKMTIRGLENGVFKNWI